jgi:hypothetical protein
MCIEQDMSNDHVHAFRSTRQSLSSPCRLGCRRTPGVSNPEHAPLGVKS